MSDPVRIVVKNYRAEVRAPPAQYPSITYDSSLHTLIEELGTNSRIDLTKCTACIGQYPRRMRVLFCSPTDHQDSLWDSLPRLLGLVETPYLDFTEIDRLSDARSIFVEYPIPYHEAGVACWPGDTGAHVNRARMSHPAKGRFTCDATTYFIPRHLIRQTRRARLDFLRAQRHPRGSHILLAGRYSPVSVWFSQLNWFGKACS